MSGTARRIAVALVDDHDVVRDGLAGWCAAADPPIEVVGVFDTVEGFLSWDSDERVGGLDAVVLDLQFGDGLPKPAIGAVAAIAGRAHRVVVYSMRTDVSTVLDCLDAGAVTYLSKSEGKAHLVPALHAAVTDSAYIGPRMAKAMTDDGRASRPTLSRREKEVLIQWFRTESKALAASALFLSESTVNTHLTRVRAKYAAAGRAAPTKAALVARAVQDGFISIDEL